MRFLTPLLILTGVLALMTGVLQAVYHVQKETEGCEGVTCDGVGFVEAALGGLAWFAIALFMWMLAGVLYWMRLKRDALGL